VEYIFWQNTLTQTPTPYTINNKHTHHTEQIMTWTQTCEWQGYRLTLTRDENDPKVQEPSPLPPAPGAGEISFPALFLYFNGKALHLEAEIHGSKIASVHLDGYFETEDGWLAGPVCCQELKAPNSKGIGGVEIPIWVDSNLLSAIWQPAIYLLVSGETAAWAFTQPSQSNPEEMWLHALWLSGGREQSVRLSFSVDGKLNRMIVLSDKDSLPRGSRGLLPQAGDQLTPTVNWLRYDGECWQTAPGSSNAITITEKSPHLEITPAPPGRYHIGLLVHDLDGQAHRGMIAYEMHAGGLSKG
jgi:hypothetical protein